MKKYSTQITIVFFISLVFLFSCGLNEDNRKKDSPTTGKLNLFFEEGLSEIVISQIKEFRSIYIYADIKLMPSNEKECIEALFNDSSKAIIISRELTKNEIAKFKEKNISLQSSIIAKDAIAFIVPINFPDSILTIAQIKDLISGNDSSYVNAANINMVFDNQNSGSTRFLKDSIIPNKNFGKNCSAVLNSQQLIDQIATSRNSIGVCDYALFSDKDNLMTKEYLKKVKLLAVKNEKNNVAYMPDQSNIATNDYFFTRTVCLIKRSSEFSLAKGVQTFIAGPVGQLMILKQGLVPNRQEERVIQLDMTPLGK